ncbi:hypothetical protein [Trueperella sp. LYQ143]|uniref:hypothetical protein n=1 Tax=Trueperella sp. LYQ143 TaxID=3391059 RepID=UPI003983D3C1
MRRSNSFCTHAGGAVIRAEPGMVTSEFAMVTPIALMGTFLLVSSIVQSFHVLNAANDARDIARQLAVNGTSSIQSEVEARGGRVDVSMEGSSLTVRVTEPVRGLFHSLGVEVSEEAHIAMEPGHGRNP